MIVDLPLVGVCDGVDFVSKMSISIDVKVDARVVVLIVGGSVAALREAICLGLGLHPYLRHHR